MNQGSPISPVLFLFFNAPLIEDCAKAKLPIQVGGFVDDVHLLAFSKSTAGNCRILEKAHEICKKWARTHGASFAPQKYELIYLTRRPRKFDLTEMVRLGENDIRPETSIRILGLHIDTKLRYGPHIAQIRARAATQARAIKCLAGSTWGATFAKCRTIYTMVVRPMQTFAAPIWHQPQKEIGISRTHCNKLAVIQNDCLRTVLGAYKVTPTPILEAEARVILMSIYLDGLVMRYQALRGIHTATIEGNRRINKALKNRKGR